MQKFIGLCKDKKTIFCRAAKQRRSKFDGLIFGYCGGKRRQRCEKYGVQKLRRCTY